MTPFMTRLKNRAPATDPPSASTSSLSAKPGDIKLKDAKRKDAKRKDTKLKDTKLKDAKRKDTEPIGPTAAASQKTSGWRKLGNAIKRYPNVSQLLLFFALIGGTSLILLTMLFKDAWSDRYNNIAILRAILTMELSREETRVIEDSPERVVTHTFKTLEPHVEADGWVWINRFGNTITYGKQDQRMIASCSPYSPLYMICDLGEIPN